MKPSAPDSTLTRADAAYRATFWAQAVRAGCKIAGVVVLARLVSPADHGLFAMAASVTFLLVFFRDLGAGTAAIQAPSLSEEQKTALLHLHLVGGVILTAVTFLLAPAAAHFFQEPRVASLLRAMAPSFLLTGVNAWPRTVLARDLRYREVNRIEVLAAVLGTAAMIASGALGSGAYAFVVFLLVSEAAMTSAWIFCRWRPAAPARWGSLREIVRVGLHLTRANLLVAATQQIDTVLLGRWFGAAPLGLYNRAGQILQQPMLHLATPFSQVLLAALSRLGADSANFARHLRETANVIAYFTLPVAAFACGAPRQIVALVLGSAWPEAAPMLRWLAVGAAASYLATTATPVAIAANRSERLVHLNAAALLLLLLSFWLARPFGAVGLAAAYALANAALTVPRLAWSVHGTPVRLRDYSAAFAGPLLFAVAVAAGTWAGQAGLSDRPLATQTAGALLGAALGAALCGLGVPRVRRELAAIWARRRAAKPVSP